MDFHVVCPHCISINRLPGAKLTDNPICGKCRNKLFTGHPEDTAQGGLQKHISRNDIPVVVDFWAPWCGPCKMMAPVFVQAAARLEPKIRLLKVNTEQEQALAAQYAIRSIPTLVLFKGGREVARQSGAMDLNSLINWVAKHG